MVGEGSLGPCTRPRRFSCLHSPRPSPGCRNPAPARCPLPQLGQGFPGHRARPRHGNPTLSRRWPDRWAAQSRSAWALAAAPTLLHLLALAAVLVAPAPARWRSWRFKPRARNTLAGLNHRTAARGGTARRWSWPLTVRRPTAPAPDGHPANSYSQTLEDPLGTPGGTRAA